MNAPGLTAPATGEHGPFSLCPPDCQPCQVAIAEMETTWRAGLAAQGIVVVDVDPSTWTPEQLAEHQAACEAAEMHSEMMAAADPDPDYGRDLDWD